MIRQQVGDLLEIHYEHKYYYVVVLTKLVMLGGNIIFAHHTDGSRKTLGDIQGSRLGFNICTDLFLPKRNGVVSRLHKYSDVSSFWLTAYAKGAHEHRPGYKAKEWFIYDLKSIGGNHIERLPPPLPQKYREAIDYATYSFDLTGEKILAGYTPDQDTRL